MRKQKFKFYLFGCPKDEESKYVETAYVGRNAAQTDWAIVDNVEDAYRFEADSNAKAVEIATFINDRFDWTFHPVKTTSD